eukprot:scaffold10248_cov32-Tisochrysis_lutea.AAC.1
MSLPLQLFKCFASLQPIAYFMLVKGWLHLPSPQAAPLQCSSLSHASVHALNRAEREASGGHDIPEQAVLLVRPSD